MSAASASWASKPAFCPAGSAPWRTGLSQRQGCPFFSGVAQPHGGFFSLGKQRKESPSRRETECGDYNQTVENNVATTPATLGATANISILLGFVPHPNLRAVRRICRERSPVSSSRPKGEISSPARFLLAVLVEMTEMGGVAQGRAGGSPTSV